MSSAVSHARDDVFRALTGALAGHPWRVRRTSGVMPAAPSIFIDSPTVVVTQPSIVSVSFPVVIVVDGAVDAQVEALDDLVARVWSALDRVGTVVDSRPAVVDVGGPSLRAQIVNVELAVAATTLCPADLVSIPA
jgi:hypothetical protein